MTLQVRRFRGRIVAATNRDLSRAISETKTRADFIYRIRSDSLQVPRLAQRCQDDPQELAYLVHHLLKRITGDLDPALGEAILSWIQGISARLLLAWQRARIGTVHPQLLDSRGLSPARGGSSRMTGSSTRCCESAELTADQLLSAYCNAVYSQTQSYVATAKWLGIDRRTVRARIEAASGKP